MIRKIFFITFIIFISIMMSGTFVHDIDVIININDYQISTTTNFIIFLSIIIVATLYLIFRVIDILFYPNINKYKKQIKKLEKKFDEYNNFITEGFIYNNINDFDKVLNKLKKANKIIRFTNLSKFLESEIYREKGNFKKSEIIFKSIKGLDINLNLIDLKLNFKEAKFEGNQDEVEKLSYEILNIEPSNSDCVNSLLNIYKNKCDWINANKILELGIKLKIIDANKQKDLCTFLYSALGKQYYDNQDFNNAKHVLKKAYILDINNIESDLLLAKTYISLDKKQKAVKIITNSWAATGNPKLAELYNNLNNGNETEISRSVAKKLYKLNSKSYEGNLVMANAYFKEELYDKARKYVKLAENISANREVYELMLKIEQSDEGSSAMIANLKNKILMAKKSCWKCHICKREYYNWQPQCNNCKTLDSITWTE